MASERPFKRPCINTDALSDASSPATRSHLWKDDGNVVIQAGDTQFRVHRSMLVDNSTVFNHMFRNATPQGEESVEGCPVVWLADDPAEVLNVLRTLYDRE
jgi:hypothetical protein